MIFFLCLIFCFGSGMGSELQAQVIVDIEDLAGTDIRANGSEPQQLIPDLVTSINVFPNPAITTFTVQETSSSILEAVEILNGDGDRVFYVEACGSYSVNLSSGTFIVKVYTDSGSASQSLILR